MPRPDDDTVYTQPQLAIDQTGPLALSAFAHRRGFVDVVVFLANPGTDRFGPPAVVTSQPTRAERVLVKRVLGEETASP